jgi:hypothetical protein
MIAETKILQTLKKEFNDRIDALKEMENQKKKQWKKELRGLVGQFGKE